MIGHLVFNCQSWRVDAWDALKTVATATSSVGEEDGGQKTEVGGQKAEV